MKCKNAEWFCVAVWLNAHRVDLGLVQEVNEIRAALLDRRETRGRARCEAERVQSLDQPRVRNPVNARTDQRPSRT